MEREKPLTILVNYPSRERAGQFVKTMHLYRTMADDKVNTRIVVTVDANDNRKDHTGASMAEVRDAGLIWPDTGEPVEIRTHHGTGKIKAINYGVADSEWDICLLASDDMLVQVQGYDQIIRAAFEEHFPDTDGALWISDDRQDRICTIVCVGRKYYERDGYLYHPSYKSLWVDNEWTEVAKARGKLHKLPCIIKNFSPDWTNEGVIKRDALYRKNNGWYRIDERNFNRRKAQGFPA